MDTKRYKGKYDTLSKHLKEIHCWDERALSALSALSIRDVHPDPLTFYCIHPVCNAAGLSKAQGLDRKQFQTSHPGHPFIVIPSSNHTTLLADINPATFSLALRTIKLNTWRIKKRLHDASVRALARLPDAGHELGRHPSLLDDWISVEDHPALQYSPLESFSDFLDETVSAWLKTVANMDNKLEEEILDNPAPSILLSCDDCDSFVSYAGSSPKRTCGHKPANFGMSAFYGKYKDTTQVMHLINAVHSVVWLIRIELAYIVQSGSAHSQEEKQLHDCAREYDKEMLEVIGTCHNHIPGSTACHESTWFLMTLLLKHLILWRQSSNFFSVSVLASAMNDLRNYRRAGRPYDIAHHHLVTLDYLHHWERLHNPGNHDLYRNLRPLQKHSGQNQH